MKSVAMGLVFAPAAAPALAQRPAGMATAVTGRLTVIRQEQPPLSPLFSRPIADRDDCGEVAAGEVDALRRACEAGDARGCARPGAALARDRNVVKGSALAAELYRLACDAGTGEGCRDLGAMYQHGRTIPRRPARAAQLFEQGCDAGDGIGCANLGAMYELGTGTGVTADSKRARDPYRRACVLGVPLACGP